MACGFPDAAVPLGGDGSGVSAPAFPEPHHGGDLAAATRVFGLPCGGWLDLSTGINPAPWPVPAALPDATLSRLPEPALLAGMLAAARSAYRIADGIELIAGPGSDVLLRLLPLVLPPGRVAIVGPTYGGHEAAWRAAGRDVTLAREPEDAAAAARFVVVANPNNPDGRTWPPARLAAVAAELGSRGGLLIVDEAFADVAPAISLIPALAALPAIVLRSFGKFHGLAGLRLGFAAGAVAPLARMRAILGVWPVSGPALAVATAALMDEGWRTAARTGLAASAARLRGLLQENGLAVAGGTDLFVLVDSPSANEIHRHLARQGIWTRAFPDHPRWLRLGLPPADGWERLAAALASVGR